MVFDQIASMLEEQEGTPRDMFTFVVARQASSSVALT